MASRNELRDRYQQVMERIGEAAARADRDDPTVALVAVTKYASPDQIRQLMEFGHEDFGENRVQQLTQRVAMTEEFIERHKTITSPRRTEVPDTVRWHMIGHLQRNKVKAVLPLVKLTHSIDSLRLAEEIQTQADKQGLEADVLVQVNTAGEKSKSGIALSAAPHLVDQMLTMFNVRVRGLMAMAPYADDPEEARPVFRRTSEVFQEMRESGRFGDHFNVLSMGMSHDFEVAVECGANVVRIGRALFGEQEQ